MRLLNLRTIPWKIFAFYGVISAPIRAWRRKTFKPNKMRRVLINVALPWMGIGDYISVTPLLQAIQDVSQNCEIYLLISPNGKHKIVDFFPFKISILELPAKDYHQLGILQFAVKVLRGMCFDLVIHGYLEVWWSIALINLFGGIPYSIGYSKYAPDRFPNRINLNTINLNYNKPCRAVFSYDRHLAKVFCFHKSWDGVLRTDCKNIESIYGLLESCGVLLKGRILGIHPGCSKRDRARRWPLSNFIQVVKRFCKEYQGKVLVFGGPDEDEEALAIQQSVGKEWVKAIVGEPLQKVLPLIQQCTVFLCNDSGLMHVALALKIPTVAIFGPTNADKYITQYSNSEVTFLQGRMPCGPCYAKQNYLSCNQIPLPCIVKIPIEQAYCAIESLLKNAEELIDNAD